MRKRITEELGIEIYDIYGLTEIYGPGIGISCSHDCGMHYWDDYIYIEIIDPVTGEVLPDGELGEIVITTLVKEGAPLIRYRTHDLSRIIPGDCPCGSKFPRLDTIMGRTDDMMKIKGVNVFPSQIEAVLMGVKEASAHYMLVVDRVNSQDKLTVQVELKDDVDINDADKLEKLAAYIKTQIKQTLLISAKVELLPPKSIARSEGKAKRITDNRNTGF